MDNVKKILVVEQKIKNGYHKINEYVEQFLNHKKNTGYQIYFIEDYFGSIDRLLSGDIFAYESISAENVNTLVNSDEFEYIIYVPVDIQDISEALVFYIKDIDKDKLYKNLVKMNIVAGESNFENALQNKNVAQEYVPNIHNDVNNIKNNIDNAVASYDNNDLKIDNKGNKYEKGMVEKFLVVFPWFCMLLASALGYRNITFIPFIVALISFLIYKYLVKSKNMVIEGLSLIFLFFSFIVGFIYPDWIKSISIALAIMGIVLFTILNSINFNEE